MLTNPFPTVLQLPDNTEHEVDLAGRVRLMDKVSWANGPTYVVRGVTAELGVVAPMEPAQEARMVVQLSDW